MKYCIMAFCLISFFRADAQQEMYLDSLRAVLFPYNTIEEQKTILGVKEIASVQYTIVGRKNRPDVEKAYEYLKVLRKSKDSSILDSLKAFRIQYDSLFKSEWIISDISNSKYPIYLIDYFDPELIFYDRRIDGAIMSLEIDLRLLGKSDEERFNYIHDHLTEAVNEKGIIESIGGLPYLRDNIDSFFPSIKVKIAEQIASNKFNEQVIGFYIAYLKFSKIKELDQYLIDVSSQSKQNSSLYFNCIVLLSKIATEKALIHLLKEKEKNDRIPLVVYFYGLSEVEGMREAAKKYIEYTKKLSPSHKDYYPMLKIIIRFQTPEIIDFFMQKAQENKDNKRNIFKYHLSTLIDSEIEEEQRNKIRKFLKDIESKE